MYLITWETLYNSQFRGHSNGSWVRAGKIKVKIMDTNWTSLSEYIHCVILFCCNDGLRPSGKQCASNPLFFFFLLLEIQRRDWHLEILELWNVNLYASVTRSLFYMNKWTSTVRQKRISSPQIKEQMKPNIFLFTFRHSYLTPVLVPFSLMSPLACR